MKTIFKIIFSSIFCLNVLLLQAQQPLTLSLDSAVKFAIDHNKTLVGSKYSVDKSTQKIKEAIAVGLPQISASVDYTNYLGAEASLQLNPLAPPVTIEFNPTSNFKATASQLIFNGAYYVGVQLSKLAKTLSEQSYQNDEQSVKELTMQAYYTILVSERLLNLVKENVVNSKLIYEKTNNLVKAGTVEEIEAKKLSVMVTTAENALKSTERQVELGYNLLRLQLGIESDTVIKLTSNLDDMIQKNIALTAGTEKFNVENNLSYKLLDMQSKIAEKNIDLKKANYLPTLSAYYSYTEKIKQSHFDMTPNNVLGLTLSVPIFSSGQKCSQLSQAKIDYRISANTKDLLKQQLTLQEKQLNYNYSNLLEQYLNQKSSVDVAKEVLEKMNLKYDQGLVSSLELTSANSSYLTSETSYTSILLQLLNADLALKKINNKL
ncbi:MAG TPA: TolC family protein [Bacteroidales bacterium]|nr:TolC family protein [Bacteroidales bacterium]HPS17848.1 TolC family protein [Bacteroidales bacterium]